MRFYSWRKAVSLALFVMALVPGQVSAEDPVLERYSFGVKQGATGSEIRVVDKHLGEGTAKSRIEVSNEGNSKRLSLHVWREVKPDEIVFALLVFGIQIRGYDKSGAVTFSEDLPGFTFGDSESGDWGETVGPIPENTVQLKIIFYGNYE